MDNQHRLKRHKDDEGSWEEHKAKRKAEKASPSSSGYTSSNDDDSELDAGLPPTQAAHCTTCQPGSKPFLDYWALAQRYPDCLTMMKQRITVFSQKSPLWVRTRCRPTDIYRTTPVHSGTSCYPFSLPPQYQVNVAEVSVMMPSSYPAESQYPVQCNQKDGTAYYPYQDGGTYGPQNQIWSIGDYIVCVCVCVCAVCALMLPPSSPLPSNTPM